MKKLCSLFLVSCLIFSNFTFLKANEESKRILSYHSLPSKTPQKASNTNIASAINYNLPKKYDARTFNYTTSVKDQYVFGDCWAFGAISATETNLIKKGIATQDINLSEYQLLYHYYHRTSDPLNLSEGDSNNAISAKYYEVGGNNELTAIYLSTWGALISDELAPHPTLKSEVYDVSDDLNYAAEYIIRDSITIDGKDHQAIKQALMKYGALSSAYYSDSSSEVYHPYCYVANQTYSNHAITLVGYDDTISKDLFYPDTPSRDGAWIIKNSWGSYSGENGYNYLSYDSFLDTCVAFNATTSDTYDYNYFYDGSSDKTTIHIGSNALKVANVFTSQNDNEYLDAINIGVASDHFDYEIQVYQNLKTTKPESGTPYFATSQKGSKEYPGFYTIDLKERIPLTKGETFSIVVTIKDRNKDEYARVYVADSVNYGWCEMIEATKANQSFIAGTNTSYTDLNDSNMVIRLKAYTSTNTPIKTITADHVSLEKTYYNLNNGCITPDVKVVVDQKTLIEGKDYSVEYYKNDQAGIAHAYIKGINEYSGYVDVPFTIHNQTYEEVCNAYEGNYDGNPHTFTLYNYPVGSIVTYNIEGSDEWSSDIITLTTPGSIKVNYRIQHEYYSDHYGQTTITINKAPLNLKVEPLTIPYDGQAYGLSFNLSEDFVIQYKTANSEYSNISPTITNPGTLEIFFKITHEYYETYEGSTTITIEEKEKVNMDIEEVHYSGIYDEQEHSFTLNNVPENATILYRLEGESTYQSKKPSFSDVGFYMIHYLISAPNYNDYGGVMFVEILPKTFNEKITNLEVTYSGNAQSINIINIPDDTTITYRTSENESYSSICPTFTNTGEYLIYYKLEKDNYETKEGSCVLKINKAQANYDLNIINYEGIYDGDIHSFEMNELKDATISYRINDSIAYSNIKPSFIDANTYNIEIKIEHPNYLDYITYAKVVIKKAKFEVETINYEGVFDGQSHTFDYTCNVKDANIVYLVLNDCIDGSCEYLTSKPTFTNTGVYDIEISFSALNYEDYQTTAKVVINEATFDVTSKDYYGYYDGNDHTFDLNCNIEDAKIEYLVNGEYTTVKPVFKEYGQYEIPYRISKPNYQTYNAIAYVTILKLNQYEVKVNYDHNAGNIEGCGIYDKNSEVVLKAIPNKHYHFVHWLENDEIISSDHSITITLNEDKTYEAIFAHNDVTLNVDYDKTLLDITYEQSYPYDSEITLEAIIKDDVIFDGWYMNDELYSSEAKITFKITSDMSLQAKAHLKEVATTTYEVLLTSNKKVDLNGANTYQKGELVEISTSSKKEMYHFIGWYYNDILLSSEATYQFNIYENMNIVAKYELVLPFSDVTKNDWFYGMVANAYESELMSGTSKTTFAPNEPTTRGMVATILYRMAKFPSTSYQANFPDVGQNLWYSKAINWASSKKIVSGYGSGEFGPDDNVTREQLCIMIYNYALKVSDVDTKVTISLDQFADSDKVNSYAENAVKWMIEHKIISGKTINGKVYIDPHAQATRAECAKMLYLANQIFN